MRLYQCRYCQKDTTALKRSECVGCARMMRTEAQVGRGHNLYRKAQWLRGRRYYLNTNPLCVECGKPAAVVDHIKPHRGNESLFWNVDNWQSLCISCHGSKTRGGQ